MEKIRHFIEQPICFDYKKPDADFIDYLKKESAAVEIRSKEFKIGNDYFHQNLTGTLPNVYTRSSVLNQLHKLATRLQPHYGIYIFDAFRTKATQKFLFDDFYQQITTKRPELSKAELDIEVRKYVSHPDEPSRFAVPPHNSGGAIDLSLFDLKTQQPLDFGCPIDQTDAISATDFFEQAFNPKYGIEENHWNLIRQNRRLLFNAMISVGFTNFHTEWWHYDLGDCMWANLFNRDYIYDSMEQEVMSLLSHGNLEKSNEPYPT